MAVSHYLLWEKDQNLVHQWICIINYNYCCILLHLLLPECFSSCVLATVFSSGYWNKYVKILNLLLLLRPFRHGKMINRNLGFFSCQTPFCLWSSHHTHTCWAETLQHLARVVAHLCSTSLQLPSEQVTWPQLEMPSAAVVCAQRWCRWWEHWGGSVYVGPPSLPPEGHWPGWGSAGSWSHPLPSCQCHSAPGCCRVRSGVWQGTGNRAGWGGKAVGEGEQKEIHWWKAEGGYGLVFIFNNGQLWIFTQDYFRSQARLFHASLLPEFPLQLSESKWYYLQLLQESRSTGGVSLVNGCNFCAVAAQKLLQLCYLWLPASRKDFFWN